MAIIYSYPETTQILLTDMLIGTSTIRVAGKKKNLTKNFTIETLGGFIHDNFPTQWGEITGILSNQVDLQEALDSKQSNITLTTIGTSGPSTFINSVLNIPNYAANIPTKTSDLINDGEDGIHPFITAEDIPPSASTLNDVLTNGNSSLLKANIGELGLWDLEGPAYSTLKTFDHNFTFEDYSGNTAISFEQGILNINKSNLIAGSFSANLLTASRGYNLPDAAGTIALTSDIPGALIFTSPLVDTAGTITIDQSNTTNDGYLSFADWNTFNNKQEAITLTTTGSSGNATFIANTLNIPNYFQDLSGYVPTSRTLTINGITQDLSIDRSWTISTNSGIQHAIASGTDTYSATITGVTSYSDGDAYLIRFTNGNTTVCTLNINSIGAIPLYKNNDGQLIGGDIWSGGEMLCVYNSTANTFQCIGTSSNSLFAYITNADSVAITKGQPVYAFGGTGDRLTVKRAYNTADAGSARTIGVVVTSSIAVNQKGIIIVEGLLDGLNILPTATWSDGDTVYLGTTAGSITNVKQYAPNHLVYLGTVTTASNGSAGRWYVKVQNGYELDELHNVQAQSPTLKDTLWYDNTVSPAQWKTASISTILGYTPISGTGTIGTIPKFNGSTTSLADSTIIQLANGDITINGIRAGLGLASVAQNTVFGYQSGNAITTGNYNTLMGYQAGLLLTTGSQNTAIGRLAGDAITTSVSNTLVGNAAGHAITTGNGNNTFIGTSTGVATTIGLSNVGVGGVALQSNITGNYNTAIGTSALNKNTTDYNTAVGYNSGFNITTSSQNALLGYESLSNNTTGNYNIAIGSSAGRFISGLSTANVLCGSSIFIGALTQALANNQTNQIVIGHSAVGLGSNSVVLGNDSITKTALKGQIAIGTTSPVTTAKVQIDSTNQGFLPPRMTTAQMNAIVSPAVGLTIYNTDLSTICFYTTAWQKVTSTAV